MIGSKSIQSNLTGRIHLMNLRIIVMQIGRFPNASIQRKIIIYWLLVVTKPIHDERIKATVY